MYGYSIEITVQGKASKNQLRMIAAELESLAQGALEEGEEVGVELVEDRKLELKLATPKKMGDLEMRVMRHAVVEAVGKQLDEIATFDVGEMKMEAWPGSETQPLAF